MSRWSRKVTRNRRQEVYDENISKVATDFGELPDSWVNSRFGAMSERQKKRWLNCLFRVAELYTQMGVLDDKIGQLSQERAKLLPKISVARRRLYQSVAGDGDSYVYFAQCRSTGRIKIGKSVDPDKRIRALNTASPAGVEIILVLPESEHLNEKTLHEKFASTRTNGEWFAISDDLIQYIVNRGGVPTHGFFDNDAITAFWEADANEEDSEFPTTFDNYMADVRSEAEERYS